MLIFYLTKDGTKLERVLEYVDSAYSAKFFPELLRHVAEKSKGEGKEVKNAQVQAE